MKLWIAILAFTFGLTTHAAAASNSAAADAAWAEIVKSLKAPQISPQLADQLHDFYQNYPDHPKATTAWIKEQGLRQPVGGVPKADQTVAVVEPAPGDNSLGAQIQQANARIKKAQLHSPEAGLGEMERNGRKLSDEFPENPAGWQLLIGAADGFGGEKARQLYAFVASKAPAPKIKDFAKARLQALNNPVRKPAAAASDTIKLAFTSTDGRAVDLAQMTGKVVLIDFWATWCGPCLASLPNIKKTYTEFHDKGFEVIGVSFDNDIQNMKRYVALNDVPWPQFCDGGGWKNVLNKDFGITAIPSMYLVDKKGVLRYKDAENDMAGKVRTLLNEN